jgi:Xaa-Pro aminopeptidase
MFPASTYIERRRRLKEDLQSGIILFLGNTQSPINYKDNTYPFRQDSTFLYFWGIDLPGLAAMIDIDADLEVVFGQAPGVADFIWAGPLPSLSELCLKSGVDNHQTPDQLQAALDNARQKGRRVHFLPPFRGENFIKIQQLLGLNPADAVQQSSTDFIRAVVAQRSVKSEEEILEIEAALGAACELHSLAMKISKPGMYEYEAVGAIAGRAYAQNGHQLAYPIIFTTRGDVLHNPRHSHLMAAENLVINDCGCESALHYASDITRTFPVGGAFSRQQKEIYDIVLNAQLGAIAAVRAGVEYLQVHLISALEIAKGLKAIGLMRGDSEAAVAAGAHALFYPHGLGHMLGLDVHDMEDLGEDFVGYTQTIRRSSQFGLRYLRLAKKLAAGFVVTVEPGVYFIPALIDRWKAENRFEAFIDYAEVENYRGFGGVRIEDNVLVLEDGHRVLGQPIAKTTEAIEALCAN